MTRWFSPALSWSLTGVRIAIPYALIGAIIGYFLGHWLGDFLSSGYLQNSLSDSNDVPIVLGYAFGVIGWLAGLGVFNDLLRQMAGRPVQAVREEVEASAGLARYFRYSLDHKVVGIQYLVGMIIYFCTAGLFAMAGAVCAFYIGSVYPQFAVDPLVTIGSVLMVYLGGKATLWGPVLGSLILVPAQQYFAYRLGASQLYLIGYAAVFLVVMLVLPRGILPSLADTIRKRRSGRDRGGPASPVERPAKELVAS